MLGVVSNDYEVVENIDAFRFLDALIGSELPFETAGSLCRRSRPPACSRPGPRAVTQAEAIEGL